ncbi:hypothetical protein DV738_g4490, partial [Chaetothyriales sp. CBS 135597]
MPAPPYIPTPRTTDASYLSTGLERLGEMSPEKSFVNPQQGRDLITQIRSTRHSASSNQKTPRNVTRDALRLLPNGNQGKSEFTPLMKSGVKNNMARRLSARRTGGIETPAYLRNGYVEGKTPGLPKLEDYNNNYSHLQSENTSSSAGNGGNNDYTPMPKMISSSARSTPLAQLPRQDIGGAVVNDGNVMTLREQENIINKIEKENFGLKMKIIFLESALSKRGAEFNQAALKENTDLKVNRVTMQRELHKLKKNIAQAERDAETYRLQLEEYRERIRRKHVDETVRVELENLRTELKSREKEMASFEEKQQLRESEKDAELRRLRDEIEDLQAEIRDKDREIDSRDDELDQMKVNASKDSNASAELEDELETVKQQKRRAEENLAELQDEVANKSFTTKGMSRQLEEKVNKLEDELEELSARHADTQRELQLKEQSEKRLQERVRDLEREGASDSRHLQQQLDLAQQQRATFERKLLNMTKQAETAERELQIKTDEKDLLQTRHDALTTESAQLQADLAKARKSIHELELSLDIERQRSGQQDNVLRTQHQHELEQLNEQIDSLHRDLNSKKNEHDADIEEFEAKRKSLESAVARAEEKANGLQRTVDKLQEAQGTLSGREMMLQEAVESEKQRHQQEEKVLSKQIEELNDDLAAKRLAAESNRTELNNAKEELRISIREQAALKEKVAELEEEIEVLQADIEQEHELVEQFQKKSNDNADAQVIKLKREKQGLQESLATAQMELQDVRRELQAAEADREELESKLVKAQKSADDTFNVDSEKRELSRAKQKLEKEVERLKSERDSLQASNDALEDEINREVERAAAEEDRLNSELDRLRYKQVSGTESRERDLRAAKNKAERLESRVKELEDMLENQSRAFDGPAGDLSGLQNDLEHARRREAVAIKKESELKAANRDLKMKVNDLERELHEARLSQLKSRSPSASPPNQKELAQLRQQLVEARAEIKELKLQTGFDDLSVHLAVRESEVKEMKRQLMRMREERKAANDKADAAESELEILQTRYENMLEKMSSGKHNTDDIRRKEIKGLIKEITWLKAKCRREERLRKDIAFSKKYLEQGEAMRMQCNQIDLRILREMGVEIDKAKYQTRLKPIQKFRAGVFAVIAAIRMSDMEEQWRDVKKLGDELQSLRTTKQPPAVGQARFHGEMVLAPSSPVLYPQSSSPAPAQPQQQLKKRRLFQPFVSEPTAKKTKLVGGFEVDIDEAADEGSDDGNRATNGDEAGHDGNLNLSLPPLPPVDLDEIDQPPPTLPDRPPSPEVPSFSRPLLRRRAARTISLETSSGEVIDIPIRTKADAQSYEAIIAERSKTKEGRAKKAYYGIEIHKLIDEARLQRVIDENEREAQRQKASEPPRQSSSGQAASVKARTSAHLLWTEKYRARKFTELVGDERTHRQVLRWLKAWDPIVFPASCRRTKTRTRIYQDDKNSSSSSSNNRSDDKDGNNNTHHRKILLLTGPPGLGKTTLAHVCARQAGYEVLEINASDDRSRDVVRGRIKDALGTETVRGIQEPGKERKIGRPVCVVVDEVDGVVTGSGGSGEGGFMKALIDLVQLDQRNLAYQQQHQHSHQTDVAGRKKKKGDRFRMLRPLILVCNDVYAPSLRPLRTSGLAEIVHVRKPALEKVVSRLKNVFEQEHIPCDTDAVRRICASAWGLGSRSSSTGGAGEGDIRGILVNAEWIAHKFRARHASDHRPRLTRQWVDSHLAEASSSGATSASTTSAKGLGRGGVREVIDRIFIDGAGLPNLSASTRLLSADEARLVAESKSTTSIGISDLRKRAAIAHLREMIDQCGEYDRVMTDCFAAYPLQVYQDDVRLTKPNMGYDWLHFHDMMSSRVYGAHDWELLPYLNTGACGFHDLFASKHGGEDEEEAEGSGHHPFAGVRADFAANEAEKANRTMLAELQDRFQAKLLRMFSSLDNIATELVPHVVGRMMAPDIKPVVVGGSSGGSTGGGSVASVRKESEKKCVRTCVKVMNALDVRFEKVKVELEVGAAGVAAAGHTRGGFAYRMEPPLDMLTSFHIAKDHSSSSYSSSSAPVRYAVRQVLDQELRKEKAVQAALSRQARSTALGHEIKPTNNKNKAPPAPALSKAEQIKQQSAKVKRDFFVEEDQQQYH